MIWGHASLSSALVFPGEDPYPLQLVPFVGERMASATYSRLLAGEALLEIVAEVREAGYEPRAVAFDARFTSRRALRSLSLQSVPFGGGFRTGTWVVHHKERVQVRDVAERFPPGRARYYRRFGVYAKRTSVTLEEAGLVDLVIIWKGKADGRERFALLSTVREGVQGVLEIWRQRWGLESCHSLFKQSFGLSECQYRRCAAHLKRAGLVLEAFHEVRAERSRSPALTWRKAQRAVAYRRRNDTPTGTTVLAA